MERKEILKMLGIALKWEEDFVVDYDSEITWEFLKAKLPKEKFIRVGKLLRKNISDTERHYKIIKELMEKLRSGEYGA